MAIKNLVFLLSVLNQLAIEDAGGEDFMSGSKASKGPKKSVKTSTASKKSATTAATASSSKKGYDYFMVNIVTVSQKLSTAFHFLRGFWILVRCMLRTFSFLHNIIS